MASYKHAQNGILATTSSSPTGVLQITDSIAGTQKADRVRDLGPITITGRGDGRLQFTVLSGPGSEYKQIALAVDQRGP